MLTATFLHAEGLGEASEIKLWESGILSWEQALAAESLPLPPAKAALLRPALEDSVAALERRDVRWLAKHIPSREHWRAYQTFADSLAYVDIETNGGFEADDVTVIGIYDGYESTILLKGRDLDRFPEIVAKYEILVTFFGGGFDLPFLRRRFPDVPLDQLHIDLCPALRRLGYKGGLKAIEERLGFLRTPEIEGMSGMDAVYLWNLWERRKDRAALDRLIQYNRADIENLKLLLEWAHPRLVEASGFPGKVQ